MAGLNRSQVHRVVKDLEQQGCVVRRTTNGYWVGFPDGKKSATIHLSASDKRSTMNFRAFVLAAGLKWNF